MTVAATEAPETSTAPAPEEGTPAPDVETPEGEAAAPEENPLDSKLASMAGQNKGLQRELVKLQATSRRDAEQLRELRAEREALDGMSPMEKVKHLGLDFGELTGDVLKGMDADDETPEQKHIRELLEDKRAREERDAQTAAEAQTAAQQEAEQATLKAIGDGMSARDDLPIASALPEIGPRLMLQKCRAYAKEYGQNPDADTQLEFAHEVETELADTVLAQIEAIAQRTKGGDFGAKVLAFFTKADDPPTAPSDEQAESGRKKAPRTTAEPGLTNSTGSAPGGRRAAERLTREQRRARALERIA